MSEDFIGLKITPAAADLIATFMGDEHFDQEEFSWIEWIDTWNGLMTILMEIKRMYKYDVDIDLSGICTISNRSSFSLSRLDYYVFTNSRADDPCSAIYDSIIQFIEWENAK